MNSLAIHIIFFGGSKILKNLYLVLTKSKNEVLNFNYFTFLSLYSQYPVLSNAALIHKNDPSSYQISVFNLLSFDKLGSDELKLKRNVCTLYHLFALLLYL